MMRDYWVYQHRQSETAQWALYIVKEYERGKPDKTTLDVTIYSEDIDNQTHSISFVGWHYDTVGGYVDAILTALLKICIITGDDREQLEREILRILQ